MYKDVEVQYTLSVSQDFLEGNLRMNFDWENVRYFDIVFLFNFSSAFQVLYEQLPARWLRLCVKATVSWAQRNVNQPHERLCSGLWYHFYNLLRLAYNISKCTMGEYLLVSYGGYRCLNDGSHSPQNHNDHISWLKHSWKELYRKIVTIWCALKN